MLPYPQASDLFVFHPESCAHGLYHVDFRAIPLGDLDLRSEIHLDDAGVVNRYRAVSSARRIYSARIDGRQSDMTVAVYEGENAEGVCLLVFTHCVS